MPTVIDISNVNGAVDWNHVRGAGINAAYIKHLRELGCHEFSVWTIDDPKVAKFYADLGTWSITTNRPGWLREQLQKTQ